LRWGIGDDWIGKYQFFIPRPFPDRERPRLFIKLRRGSHLLILPNQTKKCIILAGNSRIKFFMGFAFLIHSRDYTDVARKFEIAIFSKP